MTMGAHLLPTSRGSVTLASTDPLIQPVIDPGYLQTEVDRYVMREGVRMQIALMSGNSTVLGREIFDGEESNGAGFVEPLTEAATDEYIDARARAAAG